MDKLISYHLTNYHSYKYHTFIIIMFENIENNYRIYIRWILELSIILTVYTEYWLSYKKLDIYRQMDNA